MCPLEVCRLLADAVLSEKLLQVRILRGALERNANAAAERYPVRIDSDGIHGDEPIGRAIDVRTRNDQGNSRDARGAISRRADAQASRDS